MSETINLVSKSISFSGALALGDERRRAMKTGVPSFTLSTPLNLSGMILSVFVTGGTASCISFVNLY